MIRNDASKCIVNKFSALIFFLSKNSIIEFADVGKGAKNIDELELLMYGFSNIFLSKLSLIFDPLIVIIKTYK